MSITPIDMAVRVLKIHLAPTEANSEIVLKEWGLCHLITIHSSKTLTVYFVVVVFCFKKENC